MDDAPIVRFVSQRESHLGDCTIAAFAMCLGLTYSEALVAIARVAPHVLREGADWRDLKRAGRAFGVAFVKKARFDLDDLDEEAGILGVRFANGNEHAVYFKRGLIFDGQSSAVWDADVYLRVTRVTVTTMLVRTDVSLVVDCKPVTPVRAKRTRATRTVAGEGKI